MTLKANRQEKEYAAFPSCLHHCATTKNYISLEALKATIRHDMADPVTMIPHSLDTLVDYLAGEIRNSFKDMFFHSWALKLSNGHLLYAFV